MKTKNFKTRLIKSMLLAVLFILSSSQVFGQEQIRQTIDFLLTDTSIIRSFSNDTVLIYNRNRTSTFMLVTPSDEVKTFYIEPYYVNDFEMVDNTIYFCGYKLENNYKIGAFGCIDLYQFNNNPPTISYVLFAQCTELKKIDIYGCGGIMYPETHMVMTGTTDGTRSDALVDMSVNSIAPTNCAIHVSTDVNESYDDVAVTENYVIVSSRNTEDNIPVVNFWQYTKPTTVSTNIFNTAVSKIQTSSPDAATPVFLEHSMGDNYASVFKEYGFSRMAMFLLDVANTDDRVVEIFGDEAMTVYPMDIKYNKLSKVYDILARNEDVGGKPFFPPMQIYHVTQPLINHVPAYGDGTKYTGMYYKIWSIDPLSMNSYQFVASGDMGWLTVFFRYRPNYWTECPEYFSYSYDTGKNKRAKIDEVLPGKRDFYLLFEDFEGRILKIDFPIECSEN